jgi:hypothetical protein
MYPFRRSIVALLLVSPALAVPACGSSNPITGGNPDAGPTVDSSAPTVDSSLGATDSGPGVPDAAVDTAAPATADSGILGDNCPAVDAGPFVEGPHGPLPTTVYSGGGILEAPQIITFTFPTTPGIPTLEAFGRTITTTQWFADVTKDFCINDGGTCITAGAPGIPVEMTVAAAPVYVDMMGQGTAPAGTGVDLDSFINQQVAAAVAAKTIPAPGPNSLYAFYFPPSSTISFGPPSGGGGESCSAFGGYHSNITYTDGTTQIAYAIMPNCPSGDPVADLNYVTLAASHEVIEATTDPIPGGGWYLDQYFGGDAGPTQAQYRNDPWAQADSFGEVGDNCESILLSTWWIDGGAPEGGSFEVQRIWSPAAAALGHNPCIPVPAGESYYNASTDKVLYVADVGTSFTVNVSPFSDIARAAWRLDAVDWTPTQSTNAQGGPLQYLSLEFVGGADGGNDISSYLCANNNTPVQLKVTLLADPAADNTLGQNGWPEADGVVVSADVDAWFTAPLPDGGSYQTFPYQPWPFAVVTPAIAAAIGASDAGVEDAQKLAMLRAKNHAQTPPAFRRGVMPPPGRFKY